MEEFEYLFEKSFNPTDFVQQLGNNALNKSEHKGTLTRNINILEMEFKKCMSNLNVLSLKYENKRRTTEKEYVEEKESFTKHNIRCQDVLTECQDILTGLSGRINAVMNKIVPIGIQLEQLNTRRCRTAEAQKLMTYFSAFIENETVFLDIAKDTKNIDEIANIIQKLHIIAQELPSVRFAEVKKQIESKYDEVERTLIQEFVNAQCADSLNRMKTIVKVMSQFRGYTQCIDAFIEQSQQDIFPDENLFTIIVPICEKSFNQISEVFQNSEQVKSKFLLNMYDLKIHNYVNSILSRSKDGDEYLRNLEVFYTGTNNLSETLLKRDLVNNKSYLNMLTKHIFKKHFESYISTELGNLREKSGKILYNYYDSIGHQKKTISTGSFQELKRELQVVIGTRTNISIAQVTDYGNETFLSNDVALSLLKEFKDALKRCSLFSDDKNLQSNVMQLFEISLQYLIGELVIYAVDLGIQSIPIAEVKHHQPPPRVTFFRVIREVTLIVQLLNKQLTDVIVPLIGSEFSLQDFLDRKETVLYEVEMKSDTGLDRSLNYVVSWIKIYLQNEQKKSDFKSETIQNSTVASAACKYVILYMRDVIRDVRHCIDGINLQNVLIELASRFHRVIYEHLLQYNYNEGGALCVICDVNEYRKFMKCLNFPIVDKIFDTLYALCNLLLVKPKNLEDVCSDDTLAILDDSVLLSFIQLRSDFKTLQLPSSFKDQSRIN